MRISKDRVDLDDKTLQKPVLKDYGEAVVTDNSGSSFTIDLENGNVFDITLTDDCSFTFANPPASGTAGSFKLILTQDATGGHTVTWPGAVAWVSGSAPTLNGDSGAVIILMFITTDGGSTWHGVVVETSASSATVDRQVFTADGTWNKPSSGTVAKIEVWGGGAGGGGGVIGGGEGGDGGTHRSLLVPLSELSSSESVTVGSGGTGTTSASGNAGGASSFGSHLTAPAGLDLNRKNSFGGGAGGNKSETPEDGESTYLSGAGGGGGADGGNGVPAGVGGTSIGGGDGGAGGDSSNGSNGSAPGGGGGGGDRFGYTGGDGARGEVRVTVW